jgi:hypothetical protein
LVAAQESPPAAGGATPLGIRQQRVERMMEDLERKFKSLTLALQQAEPERALRLQTTLNKAKELLIQKRMAEITQLLDQTQLDTATDGQKALLADIRALLALLLDEKSDREKAREEFDRLSQWKEEIERLIVLERAEKRESDRVAVKPQTIAGLESKIEALEGVIREEKEIIAATETARTTAIQGLAKIADDQRATRQKAEGIANELAREAGDERGPFEPQPIVETEPANPFGNPSPPGRARNPDPGEKPLAEAAHNQQQAESNLQQGKGKAAEDDEKTALANLERALAELKGDAQRLVSLPTDAFEKMARRQDDIANQTGQLERKMQQATPAGVTKPQPGQEKVQQAQKSMQHASGDLREQAPANASVQQAKAIKDLQDALREIEERLSQLRGMSQSEKLARLEARFREMLSTQQRLTAQTLLLEQKRGDGGGQLARSDRNAVRSVGEEERRMEAVRSETEAKDRGLAGKAQEALDLIIDDGTTVVFPDVVEQLRDDLITVGNLLADNLRTDAYTTGLQKEVETTLEELIEALQQLQQQRQSSAAGGGGGGGGGQEPLVPKSAELKLLRSAQLRVNRRTAAIDQARPATGALDDVLKGETEKIAQRQAEIAEMTARILERTQ